MREKLSSSKRPAHPHTHGRIGAASSRICRHSYSAPTEGRRSARWYHLVSKRRPPHCQYGSCVHTGRHISHIHVQWQTDDHCSTPRRRGGDCTDRGQRRYGGSLRQRKILGACCARSSGLARQCVKHIDGFIDNSEIRGKLKVAHTPAVLVCQCDRVIYYHWRS